MRKLALILCIVILAGLLPSVAAQSQGGTLLFNLDYQLAFEPLRLQFNYPGGWYYEQRDNRLFVAPNEQELATLTDSDPATLTPGYAIEMTMLPLDSLGFEVRAKLGDVKAAVLAQHPIQVMDEIDIPVMGLRAPTMITTAPDGNSSLFTIWMQDGQVILFQFKLPPGQSITEDAIYTWGYILGSVAPLTNGVALTESRDFYEMDGFTLSYPEGWSAEQDPYAGVTYITEQKADLSKALSGDQFKLSGKMIGFLAMSVDQLGVSPDATTQDMIEALGISTAGERTEYLLFGEPAIGYYAVDDVGDHTITIVGKAGNNTAFVFLFAAPDAQSLNDFRPLMRAVLKSIQYQ